MLDAANSAYDESKHRPCLLLSCDVIRPVRGIYVGFGGLSSRSGRSLHDGYQAAVVLLEDHLVATTLGDRGARHRGSALVRLVRRSSSLTQPDESLPTDARPEPKGFLRNNENHSHRRICLGSRLLTCNAHRVVAVLITALSGGYQVVCWCAAPHQPWHLWPVARPRVR